MSDVETRMARADRAALRWLVPLLATVIVAAIPLVRYARKSAAEEEAAGWMRQIYVAQEVFRNAAGQRGYASEYTSLITACVEGNARTGAGWVPALPYDVAPRLSRVGYRLTLRAAEGAAIGGEDCHGQPVVSDYYVAVEPESVDAAAQQAYAMTASGRIFAFFDGVAPREQDMRPGGLATPLDADLKIP